MAGSTMKKGPQEARELPSGSFDGRYLALKKLDVEIAALEGLGRRSAEATLRLERLVQARKLGWRELFEDIMAREG